jgi:hypothetical protein
MIILELIIGEHRRGRHTVVPEVVGALLLLLLLVGCHEHLVVVTRRMRSEEGATSKGGQTLGIGLEAKVLSEATIKMTMGGLLVVSVKGLLLNRRVETRTAWQVIPVGRGNVVLLILIIRCHISDKEPLIIKRCRWRF